jgi:hypothetical protein
MSEPGRERVDSSKVTGIIERLEGEIALAEEPACFIAVLEAHQGEPGNE